MQLDKLTIKSQEALAEAQRLAHEYSRQQVDCEHLLLAQNATRFINGVPFRISYTGGTNDVVLTQLAGLPILKIQSIAVTNVVLSWPTNVTGFTLESKTTVTGVSWSTVSPAPVVIGTNNVVTNAASGTQKYYRLRSP